MGSHLELLVEEPSMEAFLQTLLERMSSDFTFRVHAFRGKRDLLSNLESRLRGYSRWSPNSARIVALVDRDGDDCKQLKAILEEAASKSKLRTRAQAGGGSWQVVNRIAIEELEAWYFGDWDAVCAVYLRDSANIPQKAGYRDPGAIQGGTWQAFERILKRGGYFKTGLRKVEVARAIANYIDPQRSRSCSFVKFRDAIVEAVS